MGVQRTADVLDRGKVDEAIGMVFELYESEELTVAEAIHVTDCVLSALKSQYPGAYDLLTSVKNGEK